MTTSQKKKSNGRYEGTSYRYSDVFIARVSKWLLVGMFGGLALGLGVYLLGYYVLFDTTYGPKIPGWYSTIAAIVALGGIAVALTVGAFLGGQAINKYGGLVGLLLAAGIAATTVGGVLFWPGIVAIVIASILFFYIGFRAKVPIWLQLPILNSPRLYFSKGERSKKRSRTTKK